MRRLPEILRDMLEVERMTLLPESKKPIIRKLIEVNRHQLMIEMNKLFDYMDNSTRRELKIVKGSPRREAVERGNIMAKKQKKAKKVAPKVKRVPTKSSKRVRKIED